MKCEWSGCVDARMLVGVISKPDKAVVSDPSTTLANVVSMRTHSAREISLSSAADDKDKKMVNRI